MAGSPRDKVAQGREALRAGDAVGARSAFEQAVANEASRAALEGMSAASYVLMEFPRSIDEMERAHATFRSGEDGPGAVRTARTLGYLHGTTTGAQGETAVARETLERALRRIDASSSSVVPFPALLTDIHLAVGDLPACQTSVDALAACAEGHPSHYAAAVLALARGRIALATGSGDPREWLREALDGFTTAQLPLEAALCRLDLARAFGEDSPDVAVAEARMALLEFERLTAARAVDADCATARRPRRTPSAPGQPTRTPVAPGNWARNRGTPGSVLAMQAPVWADTQPRSFHEHDLRRHRCRSPLRRRVHRHAARPPGAPCASGRPCEVSERHPLHSRHPCARSGCALAVGAAGPGRGHGLPADRQLRLRLRTLHDPGGRTTVDGQASGYAPRRTVLDKVLVDAAAASGAEVREGFNVDSFLIEDGKVVGITGHTDGGERAEAKARIVIGADGKNSHLARTVKAAEYETRPRLQYSYYTYFQDLPTDGMEVYIRPDRGFAAATTNDGLTMVVAGWPYAEAAAYKADVEANFLKTLELAPEFAARVRSATCVAPFLGGAVPGFFRTPFGPGWALVGDAGYNKDPITAQGISDAERCSTAIHTWLNGGSTYDAAMTAWQRARDNGAMPIYEFTCQLASLEPPPPEMQQLLGAMHGNQEAMDGFVSVVAGTVSPVEFFSPDNIDRITQAVRRPAVVR